jgi:tetratricopeptide (TPR) repeat protein
MVVRRSIFVLVLVFVIAVTVPVETAAQTAAQTPAETSLDLGTRAFHAGDYASAAVDLQAAADGLLNPERLQSYVETAQLDQLSSYETALVYLALAQFRVQREDDARDTVMRLLAAERLAPAYANLPLQADAADFETLAAALVPGSNLPRNAQVAVADPSLPLPPVKPRAADSTATIASERSARQSLVDGLLSQERDRRDRVAALQPAAAAPADLATAEPQPQIASLTESQTDSPTESQTAVEPHVQLPPEPAVQPWVNREPAEPEHGVLTMPTLALAGGQPAAAYLTTLRQAEALADNGLPAEANRIYTGLVTSDAVPREVVAEAAVGLYRIGAFQDAATAFHRVGAFARGEEDLRYYNAVALYETGDYEAAQKELTCALPFIEITDDVSRYRLKIEMSSTAVRSAGNR